MSGKQENIREIKHNLIRSSSTQKDLYDIEPKDSDELQLKDELNREWVEAWARAVKLSQTRRK